nr:hypothetical protein [Tanacetum cinerariifolium]
MIEWSQMLPEVLDIIAHKHITFYEDYQSFAGLCKSWRLAAARTHRNSNGPPSRFPSLMLADKSDDQEFSELFLPSNKNICKTQLPEAYGMAPRPSCSPLDGIKISVCNIGDNKWTSVEPTNGIHDITFNKGLVYSIDQNNNILACKVNGKDPAVLVDVATMPQSYFHQDVSKVYIVGLDDDKRKQLLIIYKEAILHHCHCPVKTKSFKVVAYDLESGNLSEVNDFGRKTLFLGVSSSFWTEDTTRVIKGNCIYYTDDVLL